MPNIILEFTDPTDGVATTIIIPEEHGGLQGILNYLSRVEGHMFNSVSMKETRDELKNSWRFLVQHRRTELGFEEWLAQEGSRTVPLPEGSEGVVSGS